MPPGPLFKYYKNRFISASACRNVRNGLIYLVSAPNSEVDIPVVQLQLDIAYRVREVPSDDAALYDINVKVNSELDISLCRLCPDYQTKH